MYTTKLVRDMPPISEVDSKCEGCELGKSHRLPFLKVGVTRATHKLEIVHSGVCGPMTTTSWSGIWMGEVLKGQEDTFLNETYHDKVDIPEFDIEDTSDTDVLRTRRLVEKSSLLEENSSLNQFNDEYRRRHLSSQ
ncbi:hypothetical protein Tco_0923050 [Tanacetum coccineum]|uniref:Uncharacterized protein n=1 Tax=Tanacetum coccineum TaxID=301880 RepID=A0ABQ5CZW8_9ASTR